MIDKQQTEIVLRRLFQGGVIRRMPKTRKDTETFLALAASNLDPRIKYSESEVNKELAEWMADITCPIGLDHVTLRRYLVDLCFLLRDAPGSSYSANQTVINNAIDPSARSIQPRSILEDVQRERDQRKRVFGN